ncbi:MAG: metallophosphoesterase, partial [Planctomycetota bacterium]|nr:metallophosphoesterase [Planctomycetota bacterium]
FNPLQGASGASFLRQTEADWVNSLVANKGKKKVVLLSHHPLFSAYEAIGGDSFNQTLLTQLRDSISKVTAWFWGHEHRLGVYEAHKSLARGRCLGHAAVPVFADANGDDSPQFPAVPVVKVNGKPLDMGVDNGFFKHGFAIMSLNGPNSTVDYYRQGESAPFWTESF